MDELQVLRRRLTQDPGPSFAHDETPAAVLIPFLRDGDEWHLVFTRRRFDLPTHKGQISFPGGKIDPGEDSRQAALREAHEELGIDPATVEIIGKMRSFPTVVSGFVVEPWVGVIGDRGFTVNQAEIEEVIEASIEDLRTVKREQRFIAAGSMSMAFAYDVRPDAIIWGLTAFILTDLLAAIDQG